MLFKVKIEKRTCEDNPMCKNACSCLLCVKSVSFYHFKLGYVHVVLHLAIKGFSWFPARTGQVAPPPPSISQSNALPPPGNLGALLDQNFCLEGGTGI